MNFIQMLPLLSLGKKMTRKGWNFPKHAYIDSANHYGIPTAYLHNGAFHEPFGYFSDSINAEDWEEFGVHKVEIEHRDMLIELAGHLGYKVLSIQHGKLNCTKDNKKTFHWNPITDDGDTFRLMRDFPTIYYVNVIQQGNLEIVQSIFRNIKSETL